MIFAIDAGNIYSAYVLIEDDMSRMTAFDKIENDKLLDILDTLPKKTVIVYEMIKSQGMAVGQTTFDTCLWIGRFIQKAVSLGMRVEPIYRYEEKINICNSMKAKDTNIRQALIDNFAKHDLKNGKGTKENPDYFYGFRADIWMAFAVAYTYYIKQR